MSDGIFIARDMIIVINVIFNRLRDIKYCLNEEFDLSRYGKKVTGEFLTANPLVLRQPPLRSP
jgi:hypothetical protein